MVFGSLAKCNQAKPQHNKGTMVWRCGDMHWRAVCNPSTCPKLKTYFSTVGVPVLSQEAYMKCRISWLIYRSSQSIAAKINAPRSATLNIIFRSFVAPKKQFHSTCFPCPMLAGLTSSMIRLNDPHIFPMAYCTPI